MPGQRVEEVMTKNVFCVNKDATLREVAKVMRDKQIGDVLITEQDGTLCGIVTDRDVVVRAVAEGKDPDTIRVTDISSEKLVTLDKNASIDDANKLMRDKAIRRLPIVENGKPVGILSIGDLAVERDPRSTLAQISAAAPNN